MRPSLRRPLSVLAVLLLVAACGATTTSPQPAGQPTSQPTGQATVAPTSNSTSTPPPDKGPTVPPPTTAPTAPASQPPTSTPAPGTYNLTLSAEPFARGLPPLIFVTSAPDDSGLLYAVTQRGEIYVVDQSGAVQEQPFLDIQNLVRS